MVDFEDECEMVEMVSGLMVGLKVGVEEVNIVVNTRLHATVTESSLKIDFLQRPQGRVSNEPLQQEASSEW